LGGKEKKERPGVPIAWPSIGLHWAKANQQWKNPPISVQKGMGDIVVEEKVTASSKRGEKGVIFTDRPRRRK